MTSATASTIYPLANPKGVSFLCELCSKPATIICTKCRVTFYCNELHQTADFVGIHERICELLIPIRTKKLAPIPFMPILEEVEYRKQVKQKQQQELLTITRNVAHRLMFEGKSETAMPAALQTLHLTIDLYGVSSVQLVKPFLILAEAALGLGRFDQAEGYLSQAEWTIMKTPDCPLSLRHKLFRIFGLLYFSKGDTLKARRFLAEDIYLASKEYGTDSINTAGGYYNLAKCFQKESKMLVADSLFVKVTDLWFKFLTILVQDELHGPLDAVTDTPYVETQKIEVKKLCLNEAETAEAFLVLNTIYDLRVTMQQTYAIPQIAICLAMLYFMTGNLKKAIEFGRMSVMGITGDHLTESQRMAKELMQSFLHLRRQGQWKTMEDYPDISSLATSLEDMGLKDDYQNFTESYK